MPPRPPRRFRLPLAAGAAVALLALLVARPWRTAPPHPVRFEDVTEAAGLRFRHVAGMSGRKLLPETMGAGVAVFDYDRDGRSDLFFVNGRHWPGFAPPGPPPTCALYRNRGDGTFEDASAAAGLAVELFGMGAAAGDYDNDGFPDLFVTAVGGCRLFRNEPDGTGGRRFTDVTAAAGVGGPADWPTATGTDFLRWDREVQFPASATWLDYDGDARLDLFVCRYVGWSPAADLRVNAVLPTGQRGYVPPTQFPGAHGRLYRNRGDGTFADVSAAAGVEVAEAGGPVGKALGVVACDPDRDGWPDLFVANDTVRNFFFHNVPDPAGGRRFEEVGLPTGAAYADGRPRGGMGVDAAEVRPGRPAVVVANFTNEPDTLFALAAADRLLFHDAAAAEGLAGPSRGPMKFGAVFLDHDLDGWPDLLTANGHLEPDIAAAQPGQTHAQAAQLFRHAGPGPGPAYRPATAADVGPDLFRPLVGRGCATLDYDGDGSPDVVLTGNGESARLLANRNRTGHRWVRLELQGDGERSNRDALGAEVEVEVEAGGLVRRWYVTAGRGYLSGSDPAVTVGLGGETTVDRVTVRWPGRAAAAESWAGLAAGAVHRLRQGAGSVAPASGR